jgi:hypothetical protein
VCVFVCVCVCVCVGKDIFVHMGFTTNNSGFEWLRRHAATRGIRYMLSYVMLYYIVICYMYIDVCYIYIFTYMIYIHIYMIYDIIHTHTHKHTHSRTHMTYDIMHTYIYIYMYIGRTRCIFRMTCARSTVTPPLCPFARYFLKNKVLYIATVYSNYTYLLTFKNSCLCVKFSHLIK